MLDLVDQQGGRAVVGELLRRRARQPARAQAEVRQRDVALEEGEVAAGVGQRGVQTGLQVCELGRADLMDGILDLAGEVLQLVGDRGSRLRRGRRGWRP